MCSVKCAEAAGITSQGGIVHYKSPAFFLLQQNMCSIIICLALAGWRNLLAKCELARVKGAIIFFRIGGAMKKLERGTEFVHEK